MSYFSTLGYYNQRPIPDPLASSGAPADTGDGQDLVNNAQHLADQCGQVWINFPIQAGRAIVPDSAPGLVATTFAQNIFSGGPFPARTMPYGTSPGSGTVGAGYAFSARVLIGGCNTGGSGNGHFYVAMGPDLGWTSRAVADVVAGRTRPDVTHAVASGSTPSWLVADKTVMNLPYASLLAASALAAWPGLDASGHAESPVVVALRIDVFVSGSNTQALSNLNGLYVAEYCA